MEHHYVYVWSHNGTSRYVGRAWKKNRMFKHFIRSENKAKYEYFQQYGHEMTYEYVLENASFIDACNMEEKLIRQYGLLCDGTGTLFNLTYGGREEKKSSSAKEKMRNAKLGKPLSSEHREKVIQTLNTGLKSEETKKAMSAGQAATWADPKKSAKRREAIKAAWADPEKKAQRLAKIQAAYERKSRE